MTAPQPLPNLEWEPTSWQRHPAAQQPAWPDAAALDAALAELRGMPPLVFAGEARTLRSTLARVAEGNGLPAARGRLRGVVRRVLGRQHPRQVEGHPPDVAGAHLQHRCSHAEGRPHRRPVRQTALGADRAARRPRVAVVLRRHRQRLRVRGRGPPARSAAHGARLQPGRGHAQPVARVHEGRVRRPARRAPVEPRVHREPPRRSPLRRARPGDRPRAAVHGGVRHRPRLRGPAPRSRLLHVARGVAARLRRGADPPRQPHRRLVRLLGAPALDRAPHASARRRARGVPLRRAEPDRR